MGSKIDRRDFLALMGLGGTAAATMSCGNSGYFDETWAPWTDPVEGSIPYVPDYYATAVREAGGVGLWIKTIGGRAQKVEGNPDCPLAQGGSTARQQALVQGLYVQERVRKPRGKNGGVTWLQARARLKERIEAAQGKNVYALTGPSSGAVNKLWTRFVSEMGGGRLVQFEPFANSGMAKASELVFGQAAVPLFSLKGADAVCSLGAQFLETWGEVNANSRDYAAMREVHDGKRGVHFQFEAKMTGTGANADHHFYAKPGSETLVALALLAMVAEGSSKLNEADKARIAGLTAGVTAQAAADAAGLDVHDLESAAEALTAASSAVVLPAEGLALGQDMVKHYAAVLLLNKALGAIGPRVNYAAAVPIERVSSHKPLADLIEAMNAGQVDVLIIKDANPAYFMPDGRFAKALEKVGFTIAFAESENETLPLADLVIPVPHDLEAWGELNPRQGMNLLQQPVMRPRWDMDQAEDHLLKLLQEIKGAPETLFRDYLKSEWLARFGGDDAAWREALKKGGKLELAESGEDLPISGNLSADYFSGVKAATVDGVALTLVESARFGDGVTANRPWLHELPDQMTGVVWDSWLEISTGYAERENLRNGDVVKVAVGQRSVEVPVFISQTVSDHVVTLATGLGRTALDALHNRGVNAFVFISDRLNEAEQFTASPMAATISKTGARERMATFHLPGKGDQIRTPLSGLEPSKRFDRDIYQTVSIGALAGGGHGEEDGGHGDSHGGGHHENYDMDSKFPLHQDKQFYPKRTKDPVIVGRPETFYDDYKWELAVDLNKCTGCGSCVAACYAENNIPVVGKEQVIKGREMSWVRINRYLTFAEGDEKPKVRMMPMMCQQCGNAPCESVCPSLATYHNKEGLNAMVYNRCVGTRYCANNCSYKVRRFNWFTWEWEGDQNWQLNPAVTVRQKGVMEKCTFCVQRIRAAKDTARDQGRKVADGEVMTACQQACPAQAIQFGNYEDENSVVHKQAVDARAYRALDDHLHTKPAISYLRRVTVEDEHHA